MDPFIASTLSHYAHQLNHAGHGGKRSVIAEACEKMGISDKTFYRLLKKVSAPPRKRRADAGGTVLTLDEAQIISAYVMEGYRLNGKRKAVSIDTAVTVLRQAGKIIAGTVNEATGEISYLSMSAIHRAMKVYILHPSQLRVAPTANKLATQHPNQQWQIDSSVCVLYYLPDGKHVLEELDEAVHYKNKPQNLKAIELLRVIRYVLTDHTTNVTRLRFYPHSENARHSVDFLCWAMAHKDNPCDPFEGRPFELYVDPGSVAGGLVRRLCNRMGIKLTVHKPKNSKATGSVENGQWRVESLFEQSLRFVRNRINSFDDLNALADIWQLHYNATAVHSRHGMTRFEAWQHIKPEQLIVTREASVLRDLATHEPVSRKVSANLTVEFNGKTWSARTVPGVMVKGDLAICWHPFREVAMAVFHDTDGREVHHELENVSGVVDPERGLWGFQTDANPVGEYHAMPDTVGERNRKSLALMASGSKTHEEDDKKRRKVRDFSPFGGDINPFHAAETAQLPIYQPVGGTVLDMPAPRIEAQPLAVINAAQILMAKLATVGIDWTAAHMKTLRTRYPNGVPETDMALLTDEFTGATAPKLAIVK